MRDDKLKQLRENWDQIRGFKSFGEGWADPEGNDLADATGESEIMSGISILQSLAKGHGDDLSYEDIEDAIKTVSALKLLIAASTKELKNQIEINKLAKPLKTGNIEGDME